MDDIFNIHESESENEDFSDEEESKLSSLKSKRTNDTEDDSESDNDDNDNKDNNDINDSESDNEKDDEDNKDDSESDNKKDDKDNKNDSELDNKKNEKNKNNLKGTKDNRFDMSKFDEEDKDDNDKDENKEDKKEDKKQKKVKKPLSESKLKKFNVQHQKTGVVYLSKIPPFMKPIKLRHLLSRYAKIGRIYLAAEDEKIAHRRKKYGGNRKRNYTEGWVEFLDKREAKLVVNHLNNHIIGGKKSNWYHDDIWNMKYLHGFKWIHLTERIAYEKAVRAQKLKAEMAQASRESNVIIKNVEKAKMIESMEKRKLEKIHDNEEEGSSSKKAKVSEDTSSNNDSFKNPETLKIIRKYKQRKPVNPEKKTAVVNPKQKSVLSKIFN